VFDSSAILLYLAEKTGKFLPAKTDKARGELLSWMFFVSSGVGPYFGQSVHFRVYAPEKTSYATNRYAFEAQRHAGILDARLAKQKYMLGDTYTIVDMNVWGWARLIPTVLGDGAWEMAPLHHLRDALSINGSNGYEHRCRGRFIPIWLKVRRHGIWRKLQSNFDFRIIGG
jgi:GSH-dependent disulfide-bond oxidoreductase